PLHDALPIYDAAEVAQPELPRDHDRGLEIRPEDRLLEVAMTDVCARVDVDRRHRLGLIEDDMTAGLERHLTIERAIDLVLDVVEVEERTTLGVELDLRRHVRHEALGELLHALVLLGGVDAHALDVGTEHVPK